MRATDRRLGPVLLLPLALWLSACGMTSSTEVGVRTSLFGIFEKRGETQVYEPGGVYFFLPIVNEWTTLPISQQNLLMNANPEEGDRPVPDEITFKTKDGNNVHIDVNLMWRVDPKKAAYLVFHVGQSILEIKERVVRPVARSVIRDTFNEITSEEYYHVTVKNDMAQKAREALVRALEPYGIVVDMLQVQQHRFDAEYQAAINAQKQAEADMQTLVEQQKNIVAQKKSELEAKRALWNQQLEDSLGSAGRVRYEADAYYQTKTNEAKAVVAVAQAEAEGVRKEAEALSKMGGEAYVKMQVAQQLAKKRILIVPGSNVSTMDVNSMVSFLLGRRVGATPEPAATPPAQ
ncbi:MAG TPA: SPFH domain-containing protein [Vicinamibacteria bacterium]|nr:SPFH domain-containing protein [Vicinamibacteria bacterium]